MRKAKFLCWDGAAPDHIVAEILALSPKHAAHEFVTGGEWYGAKSVPVAVIRKSQYRPSLSTQPGAMVIEINRHADLADLADHIFRGEPVDMFEGEIWRIWSLYHGSYRLIGYPALVDLGVLLESNQGEKLREFIEANTKPEQVDHE